MAKADFEFEGVNWNRPVKESDIQYLLDHYPYLEIACTDSSGIYALDKPEFYHADSGWTIHYQGTTMSSSPGIKLYGEGDADDGDAGGHGTIINQAVITTYNMVSLAQEKGWLAFEILRGTALMQWAAWMAAEEYGISLENYVPNKTDLSRRERVRNNLSRRDKASFPNVFRPKK